METKINVADILRGKPQGTKLHDLVRGTDVFLNNVIDGCNIVSCTFEKNGLQTFHYSSKGTLVSFEDGMVILVPSETMQDWNKFAWKKGDVLVNKDGDVHIIFERFADDTYCSFVGKYYLWKENNDTEHFYENERLLTSDFQKAGKDAAQTYISTIEERLGGKLNRETLEIEKPHPEFKDGDILSIQENEEHYHTIFIFKGGTDVYVYFDYFHRVLTYGTKIDENEKSISHIATVSEKQQLFDALAKEGKAWDAEKKMIVYLKPKVKLKPFDKVLCRNSKDDTWEADFFARLTRKEIDYTQSGKYLCVGDLWMYCIPYNEETADLLGTTDDWKGGEG